MKLNKFFIAFIVIVLVLTVLSQFLQPKTFVWSPSFRTTDKQPMGCYVFDSVMRKACRNGYTVEKKTFYQLNHDSTESPRSILVITDNFKHSDLDLNQMEDLLRKGNKIMLASFTETYNDKSQNASPDTVTDEEKQFYDNYAESLTPFLKKFGATWRNTGYVANLKQNVADCLTDSSETFLVTWIGEPGTFPTHKYRMMKIMFDDYMVLPDYKGNIWKPIAYNANENCEDYGPHYKEPVATGIYQHVGKYESFLAPYAVSKKIGKGELILVSTPLVLSNYGILNKQLGQYDMRLMSLLADLPIVRTTHYMETEESMEAESSPMREMLNREPLRHAVWITLVGVLLFFIFTARRRQRPIPVITKPQNSNLEFIQMIGSLFYQRHKNRELVEKRWACFVEDVNRLAGIDLTDKGSASTATDAIARKTGLKKESVRRDIDELQGFLDDNGEINNFDMRHLIDIMNDITKKLK